MLTKQQKIIVALLAITQFTIILDFMVMSPLGDYMIKALQISPKQFGWAVSSYAFSAGISGLLAAGFADRYDRKKLLLFFYTGFILGTLCCGLAPSYPILLIARIITGLFGGVMGAVLMAIVVDLFSLEIRGRVMGLVQMGFAASQVLGIPVGLYLANAWDWHAPFLMIVVLAVLIAVMIVKLMPPVIAHLGDHHAHSPFQHFKIVLANPVYQTGFLATAFLSIGGFLMMPFGSAYAINNLHVSPKQLPLIFMITGISSLIVMPLVGKLSDKIDRFKIFVAGSIWASVAVLIYTHLPVIPFWGVACFNVLLFAGIMSRMIPAAAITSSLPQLKDRGAFMSISGSLQQIAGGIAAAFAGMIVTQKDSHGPIEHYPTLGFISVLIMALCVYFIYKVQLLIPVKQTAKPVSPETSLQEI